MGLLCVDLDSLSHHPYDQVVSDELKELRSLLAAAQAWNERAAVLIQTANASGRGKSRNRLPAQPLWSMSLPSDPDPLYLLQHA